MSPDNLTVETTGGLVRGTISGPARVFRGIPYAAAPVGALRFAPPRPHPGWSGVRDATAPGPTAPQPLRGQLGRLNFSPFFGTGWEPGAEYLTADVWAPLAPGDRPLPVLLFVHGGAFIAGSSRAPMYDGETFARDGLVFVSINYRLGIPGFLHVADQPDNRGLLDVVAAVNWVRHNASHFGGDPDAITLAGQSAGAVIVSTILADPALWDGVRRAIVQSGNGEAAMTPATAQLVTDAAGRALGVTPSAARMADVDDARLTGAVNDLMQNNPLAGSGTAFGAITPFGVVLDRQPVEMLTDHPATIDLLTGSNIDECALYIAPFDGFAESTDDDVFAAAAAFHPRPRELTAVYRQQRPEATPAQLRVAIMSDAVFRLGTQRFTKAYAQQPGSSRTFVYEFTWRSDAIDGHLGACHVLELPFVFDHLGLPQLRGPERVLGTTAPPASLAARMHAAWVAFAASGDPGWPPFTPDEPAVQEIGETWAIHSDPHAAEYDAWP